MADDKYPRVTPDEVVEDVTQKVPEPQRAEARQLHESLKGQWAQRYEVAGWLAKGLLYVFAGVIAWGGVLMTILLICSMGATIDKEQIDLVTGFIKDVLPFIATPLGVALGFYFRELRAEAG